MIQSFPVSAVRAAARDVGLNARCQDISTKDHGHLACSMALVTRLWEGTLHTVKTRSSKNMCVSETRTSQQSSTCDGAQISMSPCHHKTLQKRDLVSARQLVGWGTPESDVCLASSGEAVHKGGDALLMPCPAQRLLHFDAGSLVCCSAGEPNRRHKVQPCQVLCPPAMPPWP